MYCSMKRWQFNLAPDNEKYLLHTTTWENEVEFAADRRIVVVNVRHQLCSKFYTFIV